MRKEIQWIKPIKPRKSKKIKPMKMVKAAIGVTLGVVAIRAATDALN